MSFIGRALGRLPPRLDPRTLRLSSYLRGLPASPPARDWDAKLPATTPLYRNDELGDCAIASAATMVLTWTTQQGSPFGALVGDVVKAYRDVSGYDGHPETDRGCNMLDVLKYWRKVGIAGHKIRAYLKLDHDNIEQLQSAINLFGSVYCGASLPRSSMKPGAWCMPAGSGDDKPGSWGGHAMACSTYDRLGVHFRTWGHRQAASWGWWSDFVDEAYAVISDDWVSAARAAPNGFDLSALERDLEAL